MVRRILEVWNWVMFINVYECFCYRAWDSFVFMVDYRSFFWISVFCLINYGVVLSWFDSGYKSIILSNKFYFMWFKFEEKIIVLLKGVVKSRWEYVWGWGGGERKVKTEFFFFFLGYGRSFGNFFLGWVVRFTCSVGFRWLEGTRVVWNYCGGRIFVF